jgi:hypothetical protein
MDSIRGGLETVIPVQQRPHAARFAGSLARRACVLACGAILAGAAHAGEGLQLRLPPSWAARVDDLPLGMATPEAAADLQPPADGAWLAAAETSAADARPDGLRARPPSESERSYWIPALEIVGFDLLLNQFNRRYFDGNDYDTSLRTIRRNLRRDWVVENDPFDINQVGHPYQGSMYHGFARSAGLNYWQSLGYTFAGSIFWEIAGETTRPSKNDQIASGIGGSFLGEALFRMANLLLEQGGSKPAMWRELGAAVISPPTGFNRHAFEDRFKAAFSSREAAYYSRAQIGFTGTTQDTRGASRRFEKNELLADFALDYGMPGKPGYAYERPFDYFSFQLATSTGAKLESIGTRGLLLGTAYDVGKHYRGVWGLYGSYDYVSPQLFRVSTTALSLGTTGQLWLTRSVALQGTLLAGVGYAAVGTLRGRGERDYHYGVAPQAQAGLRVIFGDKASLDVAAREYYVSGIASSDTGGHDNIVRAEAAFTYRIQKQHAVTIKYLLSRRDAVFPDLGDRTQSRATIGIYYTFLGQDRFGATEWR